MYVIKSTVVRIARSNLRESRAIPYVKSGHMTVAVVYCYVLFVHVKINKLVY